MRSRTQSADPPRQGAQIPAGASRSASRGSRRRPERGLSGRRASGAAGLFGNRGQVRRSGLAHVPGGSFTAAGLNYGPRWRPSDHRKSCSGTSGIKSGSKSVSMYLNFSMNGPTVSLIVSFDSTVL